MVEFPFLGILTSVNLSNSQNLLTSVDSKIVDEELTFTYLIDKSDKTLREQS